MDARMNQAELAGMAPFSRPRDAVMADEWRLAAAHVQDSAINGAFARIAKRFGAAIMGFLASVAAIPARMRVEAELRDLTDRELADIGLTRGDIPGLVRNYR